MIQILIYVNITDRHATKHIKSIVRKFTIKKNQIEKRTHKKSPKVFPFNYLSYLIFLKFIS